MLHTKPKLIRPGDEALASRCDDWAFASSPFPTPPRLDSIDANEHGVSRLQMVRELLGHVPAEDPNEIRRRFCEEFSRRSGFALSFADVPDVMLALYFESRFEEWQGVPSVDPASLRMDAGPHTVIRAERFDLLDLGVIEARGTVTAEGWIKDKPIVTRAGIFEYRQPDGSTRREFRPHSTVFSRAHMDSLRGVPVTNGHPGVVSADAPHAIVGTVLSAGQQDGDNLRAELVIHNPKAIGGHREISLGYRVDLAETPGMWRGQRYDAVQTRAVVNHCAIVPRGRAGNARLTMDQAVMTDVVAAPPVTWSAQRARADMIATTFARTRLALPPPPKTLSAGQARNLMIQRSRG